MGASKGAFYHYFDSKADLLEAVVDAMADAALGTLEPVMADPDRTALEKLDGVFNGISRWKGERPALVLGLIEAWLADENAVVREKFRRHTVRRMVPLLATIVAQGQGEGSFVPGDPEDIARVLVALMLGANEDAVELFVARAADAIPFEVVERRFIAFGDAFDRVLGLPPGSFPVVDPVTLRRWFG